MKKGKKQTVEKAKKRILIVDDHPIMRQGIALLVNNDPTLEVLVITHILIGGKVVRLRT